MQHLKTITILFLSLIANEILDADDLRTRLQAASGTNSYIPTDTELRDGFEHSKLMNLYSKGVHYLIESHIHPAQSAVVLHGFNNYSLEHLMPKKWQQQLARLLYPAGRRKKRFYPSDSGKSRNHPTVFERLHPGQ